MTNQKIVDYVINTPNNTNPVILKQMLKDVAGSGNLQLDTTLSIAGAAADAKAVGDAIGKISGGNVGQETISKSGVMVEIKADEGAEIKVEADTTEAVTLVHSGKNLIGFMPNVAGTRYGLTITVNADGSVTVNGTAESTIYLDWAVKTSPMYIPAGIYAFSTNIEISGISAYVQILPTGNPGISNMAANKRSFKIDEGTEVFGMLQINKGTVCDNLTLWIQLEQGVSIDYDNHPEQFTPYDPCVRTEINTNLPTTVKAFDGVNILYTTSGDTLTVSAEKPTGGIDEEAVNALIADALKFDPRPYGLPVLTLDGDCAMMTKDNPVSLAFTFTDKDGTPISGMADVKKQGSSSIPIGTQIGGAFDKDVGGLYNFTIKFPEAFEAKDGWTAQKKYVFKANAIDHSHARNVCSCKLWGEIVKSRANVPTELSSLVNGGAIDGFPIAVVLNDKFYALGTFNIPKDGWMFGNPKAILCADAHTDPTKFKALATLNGDFELEYVEDEDNADWVLTSINRAIQAVIDSDGTDIDTTIGQYIDIPSAIDYYIHTVNESADDGTSKNYILVTFDGVKWYFSAYDRDTTYGIRWDGTSFNRNPVSGITFKTFADNHALMNLIFTHKKSELKARALQLNNQVTCEMNVYYVFVNFIAGIPAELYAQNCKRWPLLRSTSVSNLDQILNWYRMRRAFLDKLIEEM